MRDYAREENGAKIIMATSVDERFPPENMLDGKDSSFWMTTGMFPQEFVLALLQPTTISKITTLSMNGGSRNGVSSGSGLHVSCTACNLQAQMSTPACQRCCFGNLQQRRHLHLIAINNLMISQDTMC